ncbi:hypothetical protein [Aureibacter tunicatorum]|uniref:Uncharacterized protein n=1 Tax=Aureibacter tunicatorum TaxID=866807 RepID=A0AAE3XRT4_9BACT|nr:hypothetical protein [Aureibacter tunicatorum]MDR6240289.1 hypothetical protein [Aureibacter tunicatorum]
MKKILFILPAIMLLISCNRDFENEIKSSTKPELHIIVNDASQAAVSGAQVSVFTSEEEWEGKINPLYSGETNEEGKVILTTDQLKEPGKFYIYAQRDNRNNAEGDYETESILLNDGHTYFITEIK